MPGEPGKLNISGVEFIIAGWHLLYPAKEDEMKTYQKSKDAIAKLTAEQYRITQESGTERPGIGEYLHTSEPVI